MNKKISGEDLLFSIGELPEQLLEYPSSNAIRAIFIKKLTVAASFIVCVSVVITFLFGSLGKKFDVGGDFDKSENFSDLNSSVKDDMESTNKIPASIRLDFNASPINPHKNDNNYLLVSTYTDGSAHIIIEIDSEKNYNTHLYLIDSNGELGNEITKEELSSDDRSYTYKAQLQDETVIGIRNHQFVKDFNIKFVKYGEYFVYEIFYIQ